MHLNRNHPLCRKQSYGPTNWNSNYDRADCNIEKNTQNIQFKCIDIRCACTCVYRCWLHANAYVAELGLNFRIVEWIFCIEGRKHFENFKSIFQQGGRKILTKAEALNSFWRYLKFTKFAKIYFLFVKEFHSFV